MPTVFRPFVLPDSVNFYCNDESTLTQRVCVYNPYPFDILYKVDNVTPHKYSLSIRQGVICCRQKLYIDIACRQREVSQDDKVQIRFFKWPRPRQGVKPRIQQYLGFKEVTLCVYSERSERERTPSQASDHPSAGASSTVASSMGPSMSYGSNAFFQQQYSTGDNVMMEDGLTSHRKTQKLHVMLNLGVTMVLLLLGFLLNKTDDAWFSSNVLEGVEPHTLSVVFYTLAGVLIVKLLTYR